MRRTTSLLPRASSAIFCSADLSLSQRRRELFTYASACVIINDNTLPEKAVAKWHIKEWDR